MSKGILSSPEIRQLCENVDNPMIYPFIGESVKAVDGKKVISYGLSSMGYDIRLGTQFKRPVSGVLDPKSAEAAEWEVFNSDTPFLLPQNSAILGVSVERFNLPADVIAVSVGKSSYARVGAFPFITPLEPAWAGYLTIEISNISSLPIMIYPNEGLTQLLFFRGEQPEFTYADKGGKYHNQAEVPQESKV